MIARAILPIWGLCVVVALWLAATSPYLPGRSVAYLVGGFAGILCLAALALQPLLAGSYLGETVGRRHRAMHRVLGAGIIALVLLHVGGLYLTSPPDVVDALLLVSPTPFSLYGVVAMWGAILTVPLVLLRRKLGLRPRRWAWVHNILAAIIVMATVVHAVQITGAMEEVSKMLLCALALATTFGVLAHRRIVLPRRRRSG